MGRKDTISLGDFPTFNNGMIVATFQICGQWASIKDELNMNSNSWRAKELRDLGNEGGMLSEPAAPLPFILLMADNSSPICSEAQLSSVTDGALRCFLNCRLMPRPTCGMLSLLTLV